MQIVLSENQLNEIIQSSVEMALNKVMPLIDYIDHIPPLTKGQVCEILNISLRTLQDYRNKGKRTSNGDYIMLLPNVAGMYYDYKEVIQFKKIINGKK